jgi:putative ABC transport system ATP-binding protein
MIPSSNSNLAVSIRELEHSFGSGALERKILCQINLDLDKGKIALLTGPSGSGKTTLLTLIGGLRAPQKGSLKVLGKELRGADKNQLIDIRKSIGYIFQAHNLLSFLTAEQNVRMSVELDPAITNTQAISTSKEMLIKVGLGDHLNKYPEQLSGGQKQRVAVARALARQPQLILADEPTAALDKKSGRDVVELMQTLAKEQGCTILLVSHDNRIFDIADRTITMEDGAIL